MLGNINITTAYLHFLQIQQNSCYLTSDNPALLTVQHLRKVVHSIFYWKKKSFTNETSRSQGHVQRNLQDCLQDNQPLLSPEPASPSLSTSAIKTPANMEDNPDDSEQCMKEISKWHTPLIITPCTRAVTKNYL